MIRHSLGPMGIILQVIYLELPHVVFLLKQNLEKGITLLLSIVLTEIESSLLTEDDLLIQDH